MRLSSLHLKLAPALLLALAACRDMPNDRYVDFLTEAHDTMSARNRRLEARFHLSRYEHWEWDQDAGLLVFSDSGVAKVIADFQFVGDVSRGDSTFLWAWANESVEPRLRRAAENARRYGQLHRIARLRNAHWPADIVDGWEMASITGFINHSQGEYRAPDEQERNFNFLVLSDVRWAPPHTTVAEAMRHAGSPRPAGAPPR